MKVRLFLLSLALVAVLATGCINPRFPESVPQTEAPQPRAWRPFVPPPSYTLRLEAEPFEEDARGANVRLRGRVLGELPANHSLEWVVADAAGAIVARGTGLSPKETRLEFGSFYAALRSLNETGHLFQTATLARGMELGYLKVGECAPVAASYESFAPLCSDARFEVPRFATTISIFGHPDEHRGECNGHIQLRDARGHLVGSARSMGYIDADYNCLWGLGYGVERSDPPGTWGVRWAPNSAILGKMTFSISVQAHPSYDLPASIQDWIAGKDLGMEG